ncbi:MAG TPA: hypothetical protein VJ852_09540 [Gemmatimonadaceae bacterium]|nr:hypothetical protein [Gemmatimonadaceae bacterium]
MTAGGGSGEGGSGRRDAGSQPISFAQVMRRQGMATPTALQQSVRRALIDYGAPASINGDGSAEETLSAAERLLDRVLAGSCESRESALDLLTVDALVTRAIEIAARDPELIEKFPELAMKRIVAR